MPVDGGWAAVADVVVGDGAAGQGWLRAEDDAVDIVVAHQIDANPTAAILGGGEVCLQVAIDGLFGLFAVNHARERPVVGRDGVGDLAAEAVFTRHHHKGALGILAGDDAAELADLEALVEQIGEVPQAVQMHRPNPSGNPLTVFGQWRIFIDQSVVVVVQTIGRIFVEQSVPVVVKRRIQPVLVEQSIAVVIELRIRPILVNAPVVVVVEKFRGVFVNESVAIVVAPVGWVFVDLAVVVVVNLWVYGVFVDLAVVVIVD